MLVLPLLLVILFAMLDFGRVFNYWIDSTHLANEGARWAVVNNNPSTSGTLQAYIQQQGDTDELRNGGTSSVPGPSRDLHRLPERRRRRPAGPVTATVTYNWLPFLSSDWSYDFFGHKLPLVERSDRFVDDAPRSAANELLGGMLVIRLAHA